MAKLDWNPQSSGLKKAKLTTSIRYIIIEQEHLVAQPTFSGAHLCFCQNKVTFLPPYIALFEPLWLEGIEGGGA